MARNVNPVGSTTVGRAEGATVHLDEQQVSREHAEIHFDGTRFVVANRSRSNPLRVNGQPVDQAALRDQDELLLGNVTLRFHDLGAHDTITGPVCSHCGRENEASARDCWYCGTSLVSALSTLRTRRLVVGRILAETGEFLDLYAGQRATLGVGAPSLVEATSEAGSATGAAVEVSAAEEGLTVGGSSGGGVRGLATGDVVEAGGASYLVIVR